MINKQEMNQVANTAIAEYFGEMWAIMSENIPRERLAIAHNRAKGKVIKRMRLTKLNEWGAN